MQRAEAIRELADVELEQVAGGKNKGGGGESQPAAAGAEGEAVRLPMPRLDPAAASMLPA